MQTAQNDVNEPAGRPRQIILGCDGTNNTLTGGVYDTNVLKMISQLAPADANRILYYDPGVGSPDQLPPLGVWNDVRRKLERLAGLANGRGIYENIAEAYLFLVDNYRKGDEIYIFGFSRGAFTARSVSGMVKLFGIIRPDSKSLILTLIRVYFSTPSNDAANTGIVPRLIARTASERCKHNELVAKEAGAWAPDTFAENIHNYLSKTKKRRSTRQEVADQVRASFTTVDGAEAAIHFIGVWDTVESVGIPGLQRFITSKAYTRHERAFRHIRHAISMDEHRFTFAPRLYLDDDYNDFPDDPTRHKSLCQRWFRGVHSDVGGGYAVNEAGLSDQAYRWMLNEAIACGLHTVPKLQLATHHPKPFIAHDPCYETPWWGVAGLTVRSNVTHQKEKNGNAPEKMAGKSVQVRTEGVASDSHPRIHAGWRASLRSAYWKTFPVLACAALLFAWYGWIAYGAFAVVEDATFLSKIRHGAAVLEAWKLTYFASLFNDGLPVGRTLLAIRPAVHATIVDFGLIAAYSWLAGLYGTWAFHAIVGRRNPGDPIPMRFRLGLAPMCLVVADVAENFLSLATMWCIAHYLEFTSYFFGAGMLLATVVKWAGLLGTLGLIGYGAAMKVRALSTQPERRQSPR
jgi:uncharacterized protein (DUF2235 family)